MRFKLFYVLLAAGLLAGPARAGVILQAASASTTAVIGTGSPNNLRDQSGLSVGYTSGVTDFDTYLASSPTHNSFVIANSLNLFNVGGDVDFALGGTFTVESLALWSRGSNLLGNLTRFELLAADNAAFNNATSLGTFTANPNTGNITAVKAEVFGFAPTSTSFVRLRIIDTVDQQGAGIGEVAFEVSAPGATPVPEPSSLASLGAWVLAAAAWRWRRGPRPFPAA